MDLILHVRAHLCHIYLKAKFTEAKKAPACVCVQAQRRLAACGSASA